MTKTLTHRRSRPLIVAVVLVALSGALAGCSSFNTPSFDPSDLFDFLDTKKKLPGDRKAVFPEGVPGLEQGVPKDLYRGARASTNTSVAPEPPPVVEQPKPKKSASRPKRQPAQQAPTEPDADAATAADEEGTAAAPPAPPPPRRRAAQRQQPAQQQQPVQEQSAAPAPFPAPMPSGSFSR